MITPRQYEDAIRDIIETVPKIEQNNSMMKLMMDTLDTLGYEYGNRLIREERKDNGSET